MTLRDLIPVIIAASIPFGSFLHSRLATLAQPLRLELAEKGERLLAHPDLPKEIRSQVRFMLNTAFGMPVALLLPLTLAFPFVAVIALLFRPDWLAQSLRDLSSLPPEQRAQFYEVMRIHDRVRTANHPVLQLVLELEFILLVPVGLVAIALSKRPLPASLDKGIVLNVLEMGESKFFRSKAHAF